MATITKVTRLVEGGEASWAAQVGARTRCYHAWVDEVFAEEMDVVYATHPDMPAPGSQHEAPYTSLYVTGKSVKRVRNSNGKPSQNIWLVTVTWGVPPLASFPGPVGETINSQNIRVRLSTAEQTIYTQRALNFPGSPNTPYAIRNAVGDLYPDPQPVPLYDTAISVEYEASALDNALWDAAVGKINAATVTMDLPQGDLTYSRTFAKHTLLLKYAEREVTFSFSDPSVAKWSNHVLLLYREDTWDRKLPEKGYRWKVDDPATGVPTLTAYKDHAEYLEADGHKLAVGSQLVETDAFQLLYEHDLATVLATI